VQRTDETLVESPARRILDRFLVGGKRQQPATL
jgi:hypothetical protein